MCSPGRARRALSVMSNPHPFRRQTETRYFSNAMAATTVTITVAGMFSDAGFQQCRVIAENLASVVEHVSVEVLAMVEHDWEQYIDAKGRELGGEAYSHTESPVVFINGSTYVGGTDSFTDYVAKTFEYEDATKAAMYNRLAIREYQKHLQSTGNQFCYFDMKLGNAEPKRIMFELFTDVCPKTCENFRCLCTGERGSVPVGEENEQLKLHFLGTPFHRVVEGAWVQGGGKDSA